MIKAEDLINYLNNYITSKRETLSIDKKGHLVLHKSSTNHPTIKIYKEYKYTLWYYDKSKTYEVLSFSIAERVLKGQEEDIINRMNKNLCLQIFELIESEYFNQIIKGEYYGRDNRKS
jgi:hypothetical protein